MTQRILVTGATGYVGGRLFPRLLEAGYDVRCLVFKGLFKQIKQKAGQFQRVGQDLTGFFLRLFHLHPFESQL